MEKIWNEKFIEYMNFIINHPNYKGLPIAKKVMVHTHGLLLLKV